jgi:hypothetical protein
MKGTSGVWWGEARMVKWLIIQLPTWFKRRRNVTPGQTADPAEGLLPSGSSDDPASSSDAPAREVNQFISFEADPKIRQMAEDSSRNMIHCAKEQFGIELDWSDDSIQEIERIAGRVHRSYLKDGPPLGRVASYYTMIGSYIGEVFRRNHGGEWGVVTLNGERSPGIKHNPDGLFWPHVKAKQRILVGPEDNLFFYYEDTLSKIEPEAGQG